MSLWGVRAGVLGLPLERGMLMAGAAARLAGATLLVALLWLAVWWALA